MLVPEDISKIALGVTDKELGIDIEENLGDTAVSPLNEVKLRGDGSDGNNGWVDKYERMLPGCDTLGKASRTSDMDTVSDGTIGVGICCTAKAQI